MSYKIVAVITQEFPTQQLITELMRPYHEFTGRYDDDEYVKNIDITEEVREDYEKSETTYYKDINTGKYYKTYDDIFYRNATEDEIELYETNYHEARKRGINKYKDYYVKEIPENFVEEILPSKMIEPFFEWAYDSYEFPIIKQNEIISEIKDCKKGWISVDENNNVVEIISRENPNAQWDWWDMKEYSIDRIYDKSTQLWGRSVMKANIDWDKMYEKNKLTVNEGDTDGIVYPLTAYAYIKDGIWYEKFEKDKNTINEWYRNLDKMFKELPDDYYITMVLCHY